MFIMAGDIRRSHLLLTAERRGKRPQQRINRPQRKNDRQREEVEDVMGIRGGARNDAKNERK